MIAAPRHPRRVLAELLLLGLAGGAAGLFLASFMQLVTFLMMNFQSFLELAFGFTLSPAIVLKSLAFAGIMGLAGGVLPAMRAARMGFVDSLRAA